jgi:hypothetical protein
MNRKSCWPFTELYKTFLELWPLEVVAAPSEGRSCELALIPAASVYPGQCGQEGLPLATSVRAGL